MFFAGGQLTEGVPCFAAWSRYAFMRVADMAAGLPARHFTSWVPGGYG